jgi:glutamate/tyrosine decarboxylase-like PLP-dependent enzyme
VNYDELLKDAADRGIRYLQESEERRVAPTPGALERLEELDLDFPAKGREPKDVLAMLDELGSPATVAMAGPRYFGFVIGGSLPAALAANWLAGAWDQNAFAPAASPIGSKLQEVAIRWLREIFDFPEGELLRNHGGSACAAR